MAITASTDAKTGVKFTITDPARGASGCMSISLSFEDGNEQDLYFFL
jgi:hypothetical protein